MIKTLITGAVRVTDEFRSELERVGLSITFVKNELEPLDMDVSDFEIVICNALFLYNEIDDFKSLRLIQATSAGLDRLPLERINARDILLFNARGVYSIPMAEWALCKILDIYKHSRDFYANQSQREWRKVSGIKELYGSSATIVGFGSVGEEVAKRLAAFGVNIIAVDIVDVKSDYVAENFLIDELPIALAKSDIVVLTLPLTDKTHHLFDKKLLSKIKEDAVLINISRGAIIQENDLVECIENKQFAGVALDVFSIEPLPSDSYLWQSDRVIVSPHSSFVSARNMERLSRLIIENIITYNEGR